MCRDIWYKVLTLLDSSSTSSNRVIVRLPSGMLMPRKQASVLLLFGLLPACWAKFTSAKSPLDQRQNIAVARRGAEGPKVKGGAAHICKGYLVVASLVFLMPESIVASSTQKTNHTDQTTLTPINYVHFWTLPVFRNSHPSKKS